MKKVSLLVGFLFFSGCANFTVNGTVCDQIASEPNTQQIPKECRKYNEKEAKKAFFNEKKKSKTDVNDIIEFNKEEKK